MRNEICIIIPCYNNYQLTQKTLTSLSENTITPYTVIIVDDCSTDNTTSYANQISDSFIYIRNNENKGVNKSWNIGLKRAILNGYNYICIANNDILFTKNWDIPLIEALDNGCDVVSPYLTERIIPHDFPIGSGRYKNPNPLNLLGCCFMFKRLFIEKCGYFPEDMLHYYGDNWVHDICNKYKLKVEHIKESYIHHLYCKTTSSLPSTIIMKDKKAYHAYCIANDIKYAH